MKIAALLTLMLSPSLVLSAPVVASKGSLSEFQQRSVSLCAQSVVARAIRLMQNNGTPEQKSKVAGTNVSAAVMPYLISEDGLQKFLPPNDWRLGVDGEDRPAETLRFVVLGQVGSVKFHGDLNLWFEMIDHQINCHAKTYWDGRELKTDVGIELFDSSQNELPLLNLAAGQDYWS